MSRRFHVVSCGILLALLCTSGCRREESPEPPRDAEPVVEQRFSEQDMLGGLGYIDTVDDEDPEDAKEDGVVLFDERRSSPGYTLYVSIPFNTARLIDARGRVINEWSFEPSKRWIRAELQPDGDVLIVGAGDKEKGVENSTPHSFGYLMRMAWDGTIKWKKTLGVHHDVEVTPDGHILSVDDRLRSIDGYEMDIRDNYVIRLTPEGELVDERSLYDVFTSDPDVFTMGEPQRKLNKEDKSRIELLHTNSVEWMRHPELVGRHEIYALDNVIVSSRLQDTIGIFNWTSGKLLWAWGRGDVEGQHEASVLANGNILLFDNGMRRKWSRVIELDPLTKKIVWEYRGDPPEDFFTASRGTSQMLPNGNVLVALSNSGAGVEITRDGDVVWRFLNPDRDEDGKRGVIRLARYGEAFVEAILDRQRDAGP